jgi:hypothetical protein
MTAIRMFIQAATAILLLASIEASFAEASLAEISLADTADQEQQGAAQAKQAEFSYRRLYELLYQFRELPAETTSQLRFAIRLRTLDGNMPDKLDVHIRYGKRRIDVPVDEFGILDLPFSPQLSNVNAPVVTNQPEGTLDMGLAIVIQTRGTREANNTDLDVDAVLNAIRQVNAAMQARSRLSPERTPRAIGITVKFAGDSRGSVIINDGVKGGGEEVDYRADDYNTVDIPLDADAPPESIRITDQPLVIFPLFEE